MRHFCHGSSTLGFFYPGLRILISEKSLNVCFQVKTNKGLKLPGIPNRKIKRLKVLENTTRRFFGWTGTLFGSSGWFRTSRWPMSRLLPMWLFLWLMSHQSGRWPRATLRGGRHTPQTHPPPVTQDSPFQLVFPSLIHHQWPSGLHFNKMNSILYFLNWTQVHTASEFKHFFLFSMYGRLL